MTVSLPPGLLMVAGAALVPALRGRARTALTLVVPAASLALLLLHPFGESGAVRLLGFPLVPVRVDKLSFIFGLIFHIAAILGAVYALHVRDTIQQAAALAYGGSAVAAVFAGDLVTLFVWWEIAALSSVFLVWATRTERSRRAGLRYLLYQLASGVLLLGGILALASDTGSIRFDRIGVGAPGGWLLLAGIGIKCAFPIAHTWLTDAYAESTPTGAVYLSAFTTKLAVYALARGFPGTGILIWIGAIMAAFPIFFAVIENDLRRVLGYSMINQIGFMVVGIGVGTELAVNGAVAHAFADILFKGLLFMSMGAVLERTGTANGSDLGGLYRTMPWTTGFCIVGACSISAFPLFSAFATKSMILAGLAERHLAVVWLVLLFASAGVFHHAGIKVPFFAFFAHDSGRRPEEAPRNMRAAMALAAALCVGIGVYPAALYSLLPHPVAYEPYTASHVITQLQLLFWSALAFAVLKLTGLYPPELRSTNLDTDWAWRRCVPAIWRVAIVPALEGAARARELLTRVFASAVFAPPLRRGGWVSEAAVLVILAMLLLFTLAGFGPF